MNNYLIKVLTKHASKTEESSVTHSNYFWINGIKIRVSDHHTSSEGYDLAIYSTNPGYVCIPSQVPCKKVIACSSMKQVMGVVHGLVFAKSLYLPTPKDNPNEDKFILELNKLGCFFKDRTKEYLKTFDEELQELILLYLSSLDTVSERTEAIGKIMACPSARRKEVLQYKIDSL